VPENDPLLSEKNPERFDTIIIGGGPAGLFTAIHAAAPLRRILVLEKKESCGKKLLISGSGKCNLTHDGEIGGFLCHYGLHGKFLKPALFAFTNRDLSAYFETCNVGLSTGKDGKVFPASLRARDILDALLRNCRATEIEIRCNESVIRVIKEDTVFIVETADATLCTACVVICTGGLSYPTTGSTGDGYRLAAALGHTIIAPAPALTTVSILNFPFFDLAGMSFPGMVFSIRRDGRKVIDCRGDVLITHTGLSGPGILDNSRFMAAGDEIRLSFTGTASGEDCARQLLKGIRGQGSRNVASLLTRYPVPGRMLPRLLQIAGIDPGLSCAHLTAGQRKRLVSCLTGFPLMIADLGDFSIAMVTRGGVSLPEVNNKTMESRRAKNLFFAGEVLDIDGDTGGYNLQAAFSTGWLAGTTIRKRLNPS